MSLHPLFPLIARGLRGSLVGIVAVAIAGCQTPTDDHEQKEGVVAEKSQNDPKVELYPQPSLTNLLPESREINDAARLLAGLPAFEGQDMNSRWRSQDFWKTYRAGADAMWGEFAHKRGKNVRKWAEEEVADINGQPVVFQPFGGPNFVFTHLLFPDSETFVLCGKAPCVELPSLETIDLAEMADTCFSLREQLASALGVIQADQPETPSSAALPGALPLMLAIAARTGHVVESVEMMPVEDALAEAAAGTTGGQVSHPTSACVVNLRTIGGMTRRLFYFQQELTDDGIPDNSTLLSFLNKHDKMVVVLNGASYALHEPTSKRLQQFILNHGSAIVQDPSGLPHRVFDLASWNVRAYGTYSGEGDETPDLVKAELAAFFKDDANKPSPLPFGFGPIEKESPGAIVVARPLVTSTTELPLNVDVTPLITPEEAPAVKPAIEGPVPVSLPRSPQGTPSPPTETSSVKHPVNPVPPMPVEPELKLASEGTPVMAQK